MAQAHHQDTQTPTPPAHEETRGDNKCFTQADGNTIAYSEHRKLKSRPLSHIGDIEEATLIHAEVSLDALGLPLGVLL